MRLLSVLLAAVSFVAFSGPVLAGTAELRDPDPVAVPAGMSTDAVAKDVKRALISRGWAITSEQPGVIESTLNLRSHVARVRMTYDAQQVRLAYVGSENLDYAEKRGKRLIHSNYMGWIGFLMKDVSTNLQLTAIDR